MLRKIYFETLYFVKCHMIDLVKAVNKNKKNIRTEKRTRRNMIFNRYEY